jgi:single-stranded DNA-binding protein
MAKIEIESAFVEAWTKNDEQHPAWGMKTAEPHSRKNDAGGYDTVGRTFRTVKVSRASGIDLTQFRKGDRVQVFGKEVTETREHDGKKFYDVVVWADRVEIAAGKGSTGSQAAQNAPGQQSSGHGAPTPQIAAEPWAVPDSELPF